MVKNLLRSFLVIPALMLGLSAGVAGNAQPAAAASVYLATNNGVTYSFTQSVHSPAFSNSRSGYLKIHLQRSCATSTGRFIVRLQERIGTNWVVQTVTEPISCSTTRSYFTREFSYLPSGTYRIEFYSLSGTSQKRIHYWGVYRSDNP
ncbi:hypothetical protein BWI15_31355 [Kribbella sp. ALI-6-A]|uniref:hypothetical protein n=1 Tax=Kribbella sp. ALI-6-A TaxID=1933817 RepID=UPI00097C0847|nr:hypothetical protein [Kribbella sp. ALI-6-A]ONI67602.1 hypothetical protein BWI15_31355 [Kribbella sp. ALI-6-A]